MSNWRSIVTGWFRRRLRPSIAALAVTTILLLVVAVFPPLLAGGEDSQNEVRGTLLQALAGLVLLGGLYLTYRTFDLNRQGQVTERFTRAIDQLGDEKLEIRLGGIYALERIARDSNRDHGPITEVLTAYVRERAPSRSAGSGPEPDTRDDAAARQGEPSPPQAVATDIQAVMTVLGRRKTEHDGPELLLDLRRTNLQGADLRGANLNGATLTEANLHGVRLGRAQLVNANLGEANLRQAELRGANLERASLFHANLQRANLGHANLRDADLIQANLDPAYLGHANLEGAFLARANLQGADLEEANLQRAILRKANLRDAELTGANLRDADLTGANLRDAQVDSNTEADIDLAGLGARREEP